MSSCVIQLDNYQGQYRPGDTIVGRLVCTFNSSKTVRCIKLKLLGKEHTEWTETDSENDSENKSTSKTVEYTGNRDILVVETSLAGAGDIDAGRYEYPFSFILPRDLPSSYQGKYGWVKYTFKATVDRPYKIDFIDELEMNIVAPIDFNEIRDTLQLAPVAYSEEKTLCCCCCASDPITMNVHLRKEAFVAGEIINVKVELANMSTVNIDRVKVKFGMTIESKTTFPLTKTKTDFELLASASDTGVGPHAERSYDFDLQIPESAVIPNFTQCTLFDKWGTIKVKAKISGCHNAMEMDAKVAVGHIPAGTVPPAENNKYPGGDKPYPYPMPSTPYLQVVPVHAPQSNIGFNVQQSNIYFPSSSSGAPFSTLSSSSVNEALPLK